MNQKLSKKNSSHQLLKRIRKRRPKRRRNAVARYRTNFFIILFLCRTFCIYLNCGSLWEIVKSWVVQQMLMRICSKLFDSISARSPLIFFFLPFFYSLRRIQKKPAQRKRGKIKTKRRGVTTDTIKRIKKTVSGARMSWNGDVDCFWNSWLKSINNGITIFCLIMFVSVLCVLPYWSFH